MKLIDLIKCCLNPKVIIGMLLLIGGAFLFLPKTQVAHLTPIAVALICPLSMILMMATIHHTDHSDKDNKKEKKI